MAVPAGFFLINEEGGMERAEEFSAPPAREMGASANWSHRCVFSLVLQTD
jgi:hypothetical protein